MHRRAQTWASGSSLAVSVIACLALLAPGMARATDAPPAYTLQPLAQIGGMAGDVPIPKGLIWCLGPLNDSGQLLVDAGTIDASKPEILLQYAGGKFTPLVAAGMDGPLGPWPKNVAVAWPISMNGRGNSSFNVMTLSGTMIGTFSRDNQSGQTTPVAVKGMPATGSLTFTDRATFSPVINNRDEIVLINSVKGSGSPAGIGLFFRTSDGALQPILVPGETLPGDQKPHVDTVTAPSITDAGVVAFQVVRAGNSQYSAYQWEKGNLTPLATVGMIAPGGAKIAAVGSVTLNNQNASALVSARVSGTSGHGLYRVAGGTLTAVAVPGQAMPGGGKLKSIPLGPSNGTEYTVSVSAATATGQHAFVATLDDNSTGVYRVDPDGTLALVVKTGTTTPLGKITRIEPVSPPAMNSQGEVILPLRFDSGPETLVLLTPVTP